MRTSYVLEALREISFDAGLLCLLSMIIRNKYIKYMFEILIVSVAIITFLLDSYSMYQYGHFFNAGMLDIAISTNIREAGEYLRQYVTIQYLLLAIISVGGAIGVSFFIGRKFTARFRYNKIIAVIVVLFILRNVAVIGDVGYVKWRQKADKSFSVMRLINISLATYDNIKQYEEFEVKSGTNTVTITKDKSDIPYVVFILGESTSKNHMSIYGYELETNPMLEKRSQEGGMYIFNDVISPHSHTLTVMRELLTFYGSGMPGEWYEYANLIDILRRTDYRTFWLSNQESSGVWNLDKYFSKRSDWKYFTDVRDSMDESSKLDGELLPVIKELEYGKKNFVVIHLMGTHGGYDKRYPIEFDRFKAIDEHKGLTERQKQIRAFYDNAVLYNDYIVDSIIEMFKDKDAIIIYVSDHADEVYEDRDFAGHTESNGTKHMIEIPMLIWASSSFREIRPELIERIRQAEDRPFMTDDMIHVLLDMMKIETPEYEPKKSIINDGYVPKKRIFNNMVYKKVGFESTLEAE